MTIFLTFFKIKHSNSVKVLENKRKLALKRTVAYVRHTSLKLCVALLRNNYSVRVACHTKRHRREVWLCLSCNSRTELAEIGREIDGMKEKFY